MADLYQDAGFIKQTQLAASAAVAASANDQTFPAVAGATNFVTGFQITGGGATAASVIAITLTGIKGGTQQYSMGIPAGATLDGGDLIVTFPTPLAASAPNTAIVLTVPSFGAGNTRASAAMQGF